MGYFQIYLPQARQFPLSLASLGRQMLFDVLQAVAIAVGKDHGYATGQKKEAIPARSTGQVQRWRPAAGERDFRQAMREQLRSFQFIIPARKSAGRIRVSPLQ